MTSLFRTLMVLLVTGSTGSALGAPIECSVLQYRHDRLYFPVGEEEFVLPGNSFLVIENEDTLYRGNIDRSYLGISYSTPTAGLFDSVQLAAVKILVEACEIDSTSSIVLGTTGFGAFFPETNEPVVLGSGDSLVSTRDSGGIRVHYYKTVWEMQLDLESGRLDGCFSYRELTIPSEMYRVRAQAAPYFAALCPSVAALAEDNGLVTTSLYYRFDPDREGVFFDGDRIAATACLTGADSGCTRSYAFDLEKGRNLLRHLRTRNRRITIAAEHDNLEPTALFFSDILSRDRLRTRLEVPSTEGDCCLLFVPMRADDPLVSLQYLCQQLTMDTVEGQDINQTIALLNTYLELALTSDGNAARDRYIGLVERGLRDDVGLYPLFRPTVYFTAAARLRGDMFDHDGFFVLDDLVKLKHPAPLPLTEDQ